MEIMEEQRRITEDSSEYQWATRTSIFKDEEEDQWKQRRAVPLTGLKSIASIGKSFDFGHTEEDHTRIFASLVPDEVIYNINDYSKRQFDACLLFGDVSGFTDLCEKYNKSGKGGPSRLTQVLNSYIGAMVQEILSHDGDVLKFSGDAFIAMWKVSENMAMKDIVHEALDCSLVIQKTYGRYETDVDVVIRVKLAISSGNVIFSLLGNEENSHYFLFGQSVLDLKAAEAQSFAGDIIVTRAAWQHVSPNEYLAEELKDGLAKVYGVGPNWRNIKKRETTKEDKFKLVVDDQKESDESINEVSEDEDTECVTVNGSRGGTLRTSADTAATQIYVASDQYALRPSVNFCVRMKMLNDLKKFVIPPVEKAISAEEPIEYLTEIRHVTVLFINCKIDPEQAIKPNQCIDIANEVYVTVCSLVKHRYGCLNKVNMFDKDLMLLVIFGLRGLKHELESQIALKCAKECYDLLMKIKHVAGVGAAVTMGKTYCGAFGHTLRREYTVISLIVNKAARLMMAYPNRVICDRETFLHSKLESKNFILQEFKPLKGIVSPGPIYEFKEVERTRAVASSISTRPLLGREKELDLYLHLFELARKCGKETREDEFFGMLVVQGESRQGKTRLLEEMTYCTDRSIPVNRFTLTKSDSEIPYTTIRLVFYPLLGLTERSRQSERQTKIHRRFKRTTGSIEECCFLNKIFDVTFKSLTKYDAMDKATRSSMTQKVFRFFCYACFTCFWLIVIDNAENIDSDSWSLLRIMINTKLVFIVAAMGKRSHLGQVAKDTMNMSRIKIIKLKPIDKWFHVGLACQMLDVEAIPPELEKVIQSRSNGNPGWIESFLITLLQSAGLFIRTITRKMAYESGLVLAPLYMMIRLSDEEKDLWIEIMEEAGTERGTDAARWKMYVDSCRASFPDLSVAQSLKDKFELDSSIKVSVLNPIFNLQEVDPELAMDVLILKTFDALTFYEQLLVKCSSVLGDIFPRAMLTFIVTSSSTRPTALAVKKLFEIRVLSCARGNFIEGGLIFKERLKNPNEETQVICECKGLIIDDDCLDLPKYASCGYLRFLSRPFRETTYNLLTDNQKKEFHSRAIRFLEMETRKCQGCGRGFFVRYMGNKLDYELRKTKTIKRKERKISPSLSSDQTSVTLIGSDRETKYSIFSRDSGSTRSGKETGMAREWGTTVSTMSHISDSFSGSRFFEDEPEESRIDMTGIGYRMVRKYKDDFNIIKTFSDADFSHCTCLLILSTMYTQLIEHCSGAGLMEKLLNTMIEYCYVCIDSQNVPHSFKILEDAFKLLNENLKQTMELSWMVTLKRGKLYTIMGYARMEIGQMNEGYELLRNALDCYGVDFPVNDVALNLQKVTLAFQQNIYLYLFPKLHKKSREDDDFSQYCNDVSECLTYLCRYYLAKENWSYAKLAAMWSLREALKSSTDFNVICLAYANMIKICTHYGHQKHNVALEVFAFEFCSRKRSAVELDELKAVAEMYCEIFFARTVRSEIEKAIHIGYLLWRMGSSAHEYLILLSMLPMLMQLALMRKHMSEAKNITQEVLLLSLEDTDISEKSWYYALCLAFHLETGLIIEPFHTCLEFSQSEGREPALRDPDAKVRLALSIWLWNIRTGNWEGAFIWEEDAMNFRLRSEGETVANLSTALYLLEGLIVLMVMKMDKKNIAAADGAARRIDQLLKELFKASKSVKIILPRLYHLKTYYYLAKTNNYTDAFKMIKKATDVATKFGNELELSWINHSQQAWYHKLPKMERRFWIEHCQGESQIQYSEADEFCERCWHFTLPTPIYL
ncbi:adenylate cyclase type 10-like [Cylas formicarius]|uniref:adenylate cyclase type 10-like n=1 Tax=Cylas formicarius TaxID=197179 RepID=UPI002958593A|nr:adenylate cyclase type 10-like [Cylas formicarius]